MTNGYTNEELDWLDDAVAKQAQLDDANAKVERLTEALAKATETPAGTEEQETPPEVAPALSPEEIQAELAAIPDGITPEEMFARIAEIERKSTPAPASQQPKISEEELNTKLAAAEKAGDRDAFMAALDEAGAVDHSAWGSGKRVY